MNKRKNEEENAGDTITETPKRPCAPESVEMLEEPEVDHRIARIAPDRDYMLYLLQHGNIDTFNLLAPTFTLQLDVDPHGNTFLHRLVLKCSSEGFQEIKYMLDFILSKAPNLSLTKNNKTNQIPLGLACKRADCPELIIHLVESCPASAQVIDDEDDAPLSKFIKNIKPEINLKSCCIAIETLVKHGGNINHENIKRASAIFSLLQREDLDNEIILEIATILLKNGATIISKHGIHAFHYVNKLNVDLIKIIARYAPQQFHQEDVQHWQLIHHIFLNKMDYYDKLHVDCIVKYRVHVPGYMIFTTEELLESLKIIYDQVTYIPKGTDILTYAINRNCDFNIILYIMQKIQNYRIPKNSKLPTEYAINVNNVNGLLKFGADLNQLYYDSKDCTYKFTLCTASNAKDREAVCKLLAIGVNPLLITSDMTKMKEKWLLTQQFTGFITLDTNLDILKYVLNLQYLKDKTNQLAVSKFYNLLIYSIYKNYKHQKLTVQKLELILKTSKSENIILTVPYKIGPGSEDFQLQEPIGNLFATICWVDNIKPEFITNVIEYVNIMLNVGFKISNLPNNVITPLTMLLKALSISETADDMHAVLPLIDVLVNTGNVNVESKVLTTKSNHHGNNRISNVCEQMMVPDVLCIALTKFDATFVQKFISNWWGPPIVLKYISNCIHFHGDFFGYQPFIDEITDLLQTYGDIPCGTALLPKYIWDKLEEEKLEMMTTIFMGDEEVILEEIPDTLSRPASLKILCKYALRHSVASRATRGDTSLPKLLGDLLPPQLKPVVMH